MLNDTGQRLFIVTEQDGEVLFKVENGESVNVRSVAQTKNDRFYSPKSKINIRGKFIKVMDREKEVVDMFIKSPTTYLALNVMKRYIVANSNVLLKGGKKYKCIDLAEDLGITRQMASIHINKLKECNLIAEIETNKGKLLAINPYYYFRGDEVPDNIAELFSQSPDIEKQKMDKEVL